MVVDVSPCTVATSAGRTAVIASAIRSSGTTSPHGDVDGVDLGPQRSAISTSRWPKRPNRGTSTRSPGRMSDTRSASMPARAVPSTRNVASLVVRNTRRYRAIVWFIAAVIAGSNCPISGRPSAS